MRETGCFIEAKKPDASSKRPLPFFIVQGPNEKMVNQATIRIQQLLMSSMMRHEKKLRCDDEESTQRNQFLELKVADIEEYGDGDGDGDGSTDEKDRMIEKLTRKNTEKDDFIETLSAKIDELESTNKGLLIKVLRGAKKSDTKKKHLIVCRGCGVEELSEKPLSIYVCRVCRDKMIAETNADSDSEADSDSDSDSDDGIKINMGERAKKVRFNPKKMVSHNN